MAQRAIADRASVSQQLADILSPEYELFCCEVVAGATITQAAELIGVSGTYGSRIIERHDVKTRLEQLLAERASQGFPPRSWVEAQMVSQYRKIANMKSADASESAIRQVTAAVSVLNSVAKLKGYIVDKSTKLNAKVDLNRLPPGQVRDHFSKALNDLTPNARAKIEAITATLDEADEDAPEDPETAE